jgi:hypothetical protein
MDDHEVRREDIWISVKLCSDGSGYATETKYVGRQ